MDPKEDEMYEAALRAAVEGKKGAPEGDLGVLGEQPPISPIDLNEQSVVRVPEDVGQEDIYKQEVVETGEPQGTEMVSSEPSFEAIGAERIARVKSRIGTAGTTMSNFITSLFGKARDYTKQAKGAVVDGVAHTVNTAAATPEIIAAGRDAVVGKVIDASFFVSDAVTKAQESVSSSYHATLGRGVDAYRSVFDRITSTRDNFLAQIKEARRLREEKRNNILRIRAEIRMTKERLKELSVGLKEALFA